MPQGNISKEAVELLVHQPVDLEGLIKHLEFSDEGVGRAAQQQARLFLEATRYRVQAMRRRSVVSAKLETEKAQAGLKFRRTKHATTDKSERGSLTEAAIKDRITLDPNVVQLRREFDRATEYEEFAKGLVEAYRERRDACRIIAEIMQSEANAELRIAQVGAVKQQMREVRNRASSRWPNSSGAEE